MGHGGEMAGSRARRSWTRYGMVALGTLVAIPVVLVAVAVTVHLVNRHRLKSFYVDLSEDVQTREYRRAPDPPGWPLDPTRHAEFALDTFHNITFEDHLSLPLPAGAPRLDAE